MKRVFQLKAMLLSVLLCAFGFGAKAQVASAINYMGCDVIVRFYAIDPVTCATIATDLGPYTIPAGGPPPMFITPVWTPGPPAVSYIIVAEAAYAACGFPGVMVGNGGPCSYIPGEPMIPCSGCAGAVDNPSPTFPPGSGGIVYPLEIHP